MKEKYSTRHWLVLIGAFLILFAGLGLSANGLSLFNATVATDLGYSQTAFTMYFLIGMIPQVLFAAFVGNIWSKHFQNVKLFILVSGLITALILCLNGLCTELWQFYVISFLRGVAGGFCAVLPASMLINRWFPKRRAFMTSIVMIGSSVGGLFFTQLCSFLLSNFNWRLAYVVLGIVDAVFFVIATLLISPNPPQTAEDEVKTEVSKNAPGNDEQEGILIKDARKMPEFWLMIAGFLIGGFASMGFQGCIATALQLDNGFTVEAAANCYSVFVFSAIFGKLIMGWLYDKIGVVKGLIYQLVMLLLALVFMLMAGQGMAFAILLALCFGFGNMIGTITSTTIPQAIFGLRDYSKIYGFLTMFLTFSMGFGTTISSAIYDITGSFRMAWLLYMVFDTAFVIFFIIAYVSVKKKRKQAGV